MGGRSSKPRNGIGKDSKTMAAGASILCVIFIIVALAVDILTADSDADNRKWYCSYRKYSIKGTLGGLSVRTSYKWKNYCDDGDGSGDACKAEKAGNAWLAFMVLALICGLVSPVMLFMKKTVSHYSLIVMGAFCFIAVIGWTAKNPFCWEYDGEDAEGFDDAVMGVSNILAIVAGFISLICGILGQFF